MLTGPARARGNRRDANENQKMLLAMTTLPASIHSTLRIWTSDQTELGFMMPTAALLASSSFAAAQQIQMLTLDHMFAISS